MLRPWRGLIFDSLIVPILVNSRLHCGDFALDLSEPIVMGVVNITPDSFSDGGRFLNPRAAVAHARKLIEEGAGLIDLGAESSRPGASPLSIDEELARLMPVLRALRDVPVPISVDTGKPEVIRAVLDAGASMINDIHALRTPGAMDTVAGSRCALCVMHMQGDPQTMQRNPSYQNVVQEVKAFLAERVAALRAAGINGERIVIDPGFGFGKSVEQNYAMLRDLDHLSDLSLPILAGLSRKSMLGALIGRPPAERLGASVAAALAAVERGARIIRAHDVAATVDALKIWQAVHRQVNKDSKASTQ